MPIRLALQKDKTAIEQIAHDAYALYLERMDKKPFPMLDDYKAHIAAKHAYVLEEQGQIVGYIILIPEYEEADGTTDNTTGGKTVLLDNIGVSPCFRKKGYGKELMLFAEAWAKEQGFASIILYTNIVMRENLVYYPKLGYVETHKIKEKGYSRVYFKKEI